LQPFDSQLNVGVARDLDFEALTTVTEAPVRFQMILTHQPVHRGSDHRLPVNKCLPAEATRGHSTGRDREEARIDGRSGDSHFLRRGEGRIAES
jgi:hypothetical protein